MAGKAFNFREEKAKMPEEEHFERPKSKEEGRLAGDQRYPLREKEAYRPAKHQFIRYLTNFIEEARKRRYALTIEDWEKAMAEGSAVSV